jgi:hypothetical protein
VSGTNLFAGTYGGGIFFSANNGISWKEINTGLSNLNVMSLSLKENNLFAGTWGDGVWRLPISSVTSIHVYETPDKRNWREVLIYNANGVTRISYTTKHSCLVELSIYSISGRNIVQPVRELQSAGMHTISLSKGTLPAGMYICTFKAGNYQESNSFIMLK